MLQPRHIFLGKKGYNLLPKTVGLTDWRRHVRKQRGDVRRSRRGVQLWTSQRSIKTLQLPPHATFLVSHLQAWFHHTHTLSGTNLFSLKPGSTTIFYQLLKPNGHFDNYTEFLTAYWILHCSWCGVVMLLKWFTVSAPVVSDVDPRQTNVGKICFPVIHYNDKRVSTTYCKLFLMLSYWDGIIHNLDKNLDSLPYK